MSEKITQTPQLQQNQEKYNHLILITGIVILILIIIGIPYGYRWMSAISFLIQNNAVSSSELLNIIKVLYLAILLLGFCCSLITFFWYLSIRKKG